MQQVSQSQPPKKKKNATSKLNSRARCLTCNHSRRCSHIRCRHKSHFRHNCGKRSTTSRAKAVRREMSIQARVGWALTETVKILEATSTRKHAPTYPDPSHAPFSSQLHRRTGKAERIHRDTCLRYSTDKTSHKNPNRQQRMQTPIPGSVTAPPVTTLIPITARVASAPAAKGVPQI